MPARFELVALALPAGHAPESLPLPVAQFIATCWPGMSRAQMLDRARRLAVRVSLRALRGSRPDGVGLFSLVMNGADGNAELVAHVRRVKRRRTARRAKVSLAPPRDVRQQELF